MPCNLKETCTKDRCIQLWNLAPSGGNLLEKKQLFALLLGQLASLLITGTGVTSAMLSQHKVALPTFQSLSNYVLLMLVYTIILLIKKGCSHLVDIFKTKSHIYFLLALVDVEANFLVVKAYQYTTITSVMLLDCFTIPCVVFLTWFFLKTKYNLRHATGILICLVGLVILVYSDLENQEASNQLLGDCLALGGAVLYSISNVGAEKYAPEGQLEYLSMLGFWGSLICGIQAAIIERDALASISTWTGETIALLAGFGICLFSLYSIVPPTLILGGSALWNISLLTSDMFGVLSSIYLFRKYPTNLFYVSLVITIVGMLVYNIKNHPQNEDETTTTTEVEALETGPWVEEDSSLRSGSPAHSQDIN